MSAEFNSITEILDDLAAGKMVIMVDDEDRENEGDLMMLSEHVTPEDINFMARYGRGLICVTLTRERCQQLRLPLMVTENDASFGTNFTVSIEAAEGVTTGISAHDRARTVQVAVDPDAKPEDLVQPGHIFPIMAQPGGVLTRAGHTEAGCDMGRLAGQIPSCTIVEILNEDGTMARRPDLEKFARAHGLKIGTIADLIRHRMDIEHTVECIYSRKVPTEFGEFDLHAYEDHLHKTVHIALTRGEIRPDEPTPVRVHLQDTLGDVVGIQWKSMGWPLRNAMRRISDEGGVLVILRPENNPRDLIERLQHGEDMPEPDEAPGEDGATVLRTYGIGAQILADLGVKKMKVLSAPKRMQGISGFGLEVVEYVGTGD
jgi:3,4-dihydroxy 2-butanone 4-phosphate synthase / GTP cyclohydrolase II